jgi:SAM-dependent methyltransferase
MTLETVAQPELLPFTDFESITPKTKLSSLNLNWRERDLPEHQRTKHVHRLHPYLGKFVPQLVEIFLRKYQPTMVVDPFCGSGTTLVEAKALGIDSFGSDISEFNCLLSRVKTADYDIELVESEILDAFHSSDNACGGRLFESKHTYSSSSYLQDWFAPEALEELQNYQAVIQRYQYQDLLKVILSRSARSARMTTHFDLDFPKRPQTEPYQCYKHSRICSPTQSARQFLKRYSLDTIKRVREFSKLQSQSSAEVVYGDSRTIEFPQCDLVVTSPPYVGLIDYHEQHRYAYELLGLNWNEESEIGSAKRGASQTAQTRYRENIEMVFRNVKRYLKPDARLVVVVHDRRHLYHDIAKNLGFEIEAELHRHVNRRTGRRAGEFFESVFTWRT